jgi:transcriptional adapter 2-alpha
MKPQPAGQFDRLASARQPKSTPPVEIPSAAAALTAPELPHSITQNGVHTPSSNTPPSRSPHTNGDVGKALANGSLNGTVTPSANNKQRFIIQPLANVQPLTLNNENATDLHLLTKEEQQLCSMLRIMPKPYLVMKEHIIKEAMKQGGNLKKKVAREICRVR